MEDFVKFVVIYTKKTPPASKTTLPATTSVDMHSLLNI